MSRQNEIKKLLDEVKFEVDFDWLVNNLAKDVFESLIAWIEKYKANIRKVMSAKLTNYDYYLYPCDLDESDPRYEDSNDRFILANGAPDSAKDALDMINDFEKFGDYLPDIEFMGNEDE